MPRQARSALTDGRRSPTCGRSRCGPAIFPARGPGSVSSWNRGKARSPRYFGASLAAVAVGSAPGGYVSSSEIEKNVGLLREYLRKNAADQHTLNKLMLLWASTKLTGVLATTERDALVAEVFSKQQPDGGWSTGVARTVAARRRLVARHEDRRLRDRARHLRAAAGRPLVGSARPEGRPLARGSSGEGDRPLARDFSQQGPRSRNRTVEIHERRRHRVFGARVKSSAP